MDLTQAVPSLINLSPREDADAAARLSDGEIDRAFDDQVHQLDREQLHLALNKKAPQAPAHACRKTFFFVQAQS